MGIHRRKEAGLERRRAMACQGRLDGDGKKFAEMMTLVRERLGIAQ